MENNKVELKVNIINQLKLFKQSTFKDILCFLDEDVQNAQRAKAKEVRVTTKPYDNQLIIENDGNILDNPQSLFSIAESGWDNDVMKNETPFGMGFFSNISVSDKIEIISGNYYIIFDVNEMISTGNCELNVQEAEEYYEGFKLILNNFDFDNIYSFQIEERLERLGKYIHELDIYYNGELQEKKDLTEADKDYYFDIKIEDDDLQGWIAINSDYAFNSELNIYYKGRFVTKLDGYPYLKGDLHINDRVLNLTSPDRKDIVKDKKFEEFKMLVDMYIKQLAEDSFKYGEDDEIEQYSNAINRYIDKKYLVKNTKFATFKNENINYLKNIALAKKKNNKIKTFKDYNCYLDADKSTQGESHLEEVVVQEEMKSSVPEVKGVVFTPSSTTYHESKVTKPEITEKQTEEKDGEVILNNTQPIFWIGFDEIEQFELKFNVVKHYGIKLLVARNKVEKEMLKAVKEEFKVFHISELNEDITFESVISNTELSLKERRALMIFDMISRIFEKDHNIFAIGDVMVTKTVSLKNTEIKETVIDDEIVIIRDSQSDKVYVDRSVVDLSNISENLDETLILQDVQFILLNLKDICDSIRLLIDMNYGDIRDKILMTIANMKST
jgi:hypothetical protein